MTTRASSPPPTTIRFSPDFLIMNRLNAALAASLLLWPAQAQERHHPPQDMELHNTFYSTWMIPNNGAVRSKSCCNNIDCYPTEVHRVGDHWFAKRREDGKWILIPDDKIEQNQPDPRESPDGRSHVCMSSPFAGDYVYCAVLGSAI